MLNFSLFTLLFFFNGTATTEIYTLSLHDALPIYCFIGDYYGDILYYKNTGNSSSAIFTAQTGGNNPFNGVSVFNYSRLRFFDVDGDGDQDCFIGVNDGTIEYHKNTGNSSSATFVEQTGDDNPFDDADVGQRASPAFVNIDEIGRAHV